LPSAGLGALFNVAALPDGPERYSFIGLVMLLGIVKKNAIIKLTSALAAQRNERKSPLEAIRQGCLIRFRLDHDDHV
jgi:multidrug efflux pump subunit AcrB